MVLDMSTAIKSWYRVTFAELLVDLGLANLVMLVISMCYVFV